MPLDDQLGRTVALRVVRLDARGAWLGPREDLRPDGPVALLPGDEAPEGVAEGDAVEAFLYLDGEGRAIATRRRPALELGQVAFLRVSATTRFGAFVDWGLDRDLLVPFAEQTRELRAGERHAFGLYLDKSGRLAATMRVNDMLAAPRGEFRPGEWVEGEAWRREPGVGAFVIVERAFVGLLPEGEAHAVGRGEAASFRVSRVLPDGKIELSLRGLASQELDDDADALLAALRRGAPRVGDRSSPELIRQAFGLSKKAFKRAAGRLLKRGEAAFDDEGYLVPRGP
jgi:hypothetical protein